MEITHPTREERAKALAAIIDGAIERLAQQLAAGHTEEYKRLLAFWGRFHRYSPGNVLLILAQRPDATAVAGYHAWRRAGRQVKKGAKAISIWCPILTTIEDEETGLPVELCAGFVPCPVFAAEDLVDIATNPLPTLWRPLPDDAEALYQELCAKVEAAGYRVEERPLAAGRQGMASEGGAIVLRLGMDSRSRTLTLLHELAHQLEHFRPERKDTSRPQRELEAESAAAVVCAMLGLEHPTARDYILAYAGDAEALKASLAAVRRIVGRMAEVLGLTRHAERTERETAPTAAD